MVEKKDERDPYEDGTDCSLTMMIQAYTCPSMHTHIPVCVKLGNQDYIDEDTLVVTLVQ